MSKARPPSAALKRQVSSRAKTERQPTIIVNHVMERTKTMAEGQEGFRAGLDAADPNNRFMRRRNGLGGSGDAHMHHMRLWWMRETSRHMVLNDDLIGQALMRLADNVVQTGFRLVMQTGDEGLDVDVQAMFKEWGDNPSLCDFYGDRTFDQMEWLSQFQTSQDGEIFALPVDDGTIQMLEAERCLTYQGQDDRNYLGLKFDDRGRILAYDFTIKPLGPFQTQQVGPTQPIARFDDEGFEQVFHIHDSRRVTQHRGIPWIHAAMIKSGMLDDLQFATIVKAQSAAAHAGILQRKAGAPSGPAPKFGNRTSTTTVAENGASSATVYQDSVRYGQLTTIPEGWELAAWTPSIPSTEFHRHVRDTMRQIGATVSMPLELLLLDSSEGNWSNMNNVLSQARMSYRRWQRNLASRFHRPVTRFQLRRWAYGLGAVARAKAADGSLFQFKWVPPAWPYNNRSEEAVASQTLMKSGQASPRGIASGRGLDYVEIVRETVQDRSLAARLAIEESKKIKADLGEQVSWMFLLGWDLPLNTAMVAPIDEQANVASGQTPETPAAPDDSDEDDAAGDTDKPGPAAPTRPGQEQE